MNEKMLKDIDEEIWMTIADDDNVSKFFSLFTYYLQSEWEENKV